MKMLSEHQVRTVYDWCRQHGGLDATGIAQLLWPDRSYGKPGDKARAGHAAARQLIEEGYIHGTASGEFRAVYSPDAPPVQTAPAMPQPTPPADPGTLEQDQFGNVLRVRRELVGTVASLPPSASIPQMTVPQMPMPYATPQAMPAPTTMQTMAQPTNMHDVVLTMLAEWPALAATRLPAPMHAWAASICARMRDLLSQRYMPAPDVTARWNELVPEFNALAAAVGSSQRLPLMPVPPPQPPRMTLETPVIPPPEHVNGVGP